MGALHAGHLGLVDRATEENAVVAASIFVNPLQFGPGEDYARYPRSFERDAEQLEAHGVELLYAPSAERMYGAGFSTHIDVGPLGARLEGAARPSHFAGVATVVMKLLHAIEPTSLYLGQKDAQQVAVIRRMIADLDVATDVVVCPIARESDGLARSSRNAYLSPLERAAAPSIYRAILTVGRAIAAGVTEPEAALAAGRGLLEPPLSWEYLAAVDTQTFEPLERLCTPCLVLAVARAGAVRLLDNVSVAGADGMDPFVTPPRPRSAVSRC